MRVVIGFPEIGIDPFSQILARSHMKRRMNFIICLRSKGLDLFLARRKDRQCRRLNPPRSGNVETTMP